MHSMHSRLVCTVLSIAGIALESPAVINPPAAVSSCPTLTITPVIQGANIFDPQQEVELGNAISGSLLQSVRVIHNGAEITRPLQSIADRLAQQLPADSKLSIKVLVFESSTADAFSIPGRIYVSRKLIAMTRNEDEMAGVLAHELGHMAAHHSAIALSSQFHTVLGVNQVGDASDINKKWNEYLNNYRRQRVSEGDYSKAAKLEGREQVQADTIALYLVMRAGYSPQAFVDFFDRLAETKGNTGGFWSSLLGNSKPDSKRLREMIRNQQPMPAACITEGKDSIGNYARWRDEVMAFKDSAQESLPGLLSKRVLTERLRPDIEHVRISPDGQYVLAQDESSVFVLTRAPLRFLFRIDAADAYFAQFSPDSHSIVFEIAPVESSPRVERWDIASQRRTGIYEIYVRKGCLTTALSPDGRVLACLTLDETGQRFDYDLYDTASGQSFWHKKAWLDLVEMANSLGGNRLWGLVRMAQSRGLVSMLTGITRARFSPDGRYFLAHNPYHTLAMDLTTRSEIDVGGGVKDLLDGNYVFLSSDRLFGYSAFKQKSAEVQFPEGRAIRKDLPIGNLRFERAAQGPFVLLHTRDGGQTGIYDLEQNKLRLSSRRQALDVWGDRFIAEGAGGDIVGFDLSTGKQVEQTPLPDALLGSIVAGGASPDLNWLAASNKTRGAVWDLRTGKRLYHVRGFRGGDFVTTGLYTVFPKFQETQQTVAMLGFDGKIESKRTMPEDENSYELGPYIVAFRFEKNLSSYSMELHDLVDGRLLWSKDFSKERPAYWIDTANNTLVYRWLANGTGLQALAKQDPEVAAKLDKFNDKAGVDYIQVLDLNTGKSRGGVAFDTGKRSIQIQSVSAAGDNLVIGDSLNRLFVYSMDGKRRSILEGSRPSIAAQSRQLMAYSEPSKISVYNLDTLQAQQGYEFPSRVSLATFSQDGKTLLVLTDDQTVYTLDVRAALQPAQVTGKQMR